MRAWRCVLVVACAWMVAASPARAQAPQAGAPAEGADGEPPPEVGEDAPGEGREPSAYRRHLDNGVRLFRDENFRAAIVEFEAAYRAEPKASPLVNIALSHKALHDYPRAIEALDRAIEQHADSLKPEHLEAAKREITQLRQLLGYVTVRVHPAGADVRIDGRRLASAELGKPIPLSPGPHELTAARDGYETAREQITLTSGEHKQDVMLALAPLGGQVRVVVRDREAWVQLDSRPPTRGGWQGMLPAGIHVVSVFRHGQEQPNTLQIVVGSGKSHVVIQNEDGELESAAAVPAGAPPEEVDEPGEPRQGFYFMGHVALLGIIGPHPDGFTRSDKPAGGAGIGARLGFRVADWAAFEGLGQLTSVGAEGDISPLHDLDQTYFDTQYTLQSLRLGGGFRLLLPGRSWVRFVGVGSAGMVIERLAWEDGARKPTGSSDDVVGISQAPFSNSDGIGAFGQLELGVEFEVSNVLLGMLVRNTIQSTSGLDASQGNPWSDKPLWLVGLSAHVGYGIW